MATIYCFTSTGNSLYTANRLAEKIGGKVLPMRGEPAVCEDDVIGFVFPVYFWGLPRMVERFTSRMQITNKDAYVFAVLTCGGPVFGVLGLLKKILKSKNIKLSYGEQIISMSNYIPKNEVIYSEELQQKIEAQINSIADSIKSREVKWIPTFTFLNKLFYKAFPAENCDRYFQIASTCKGCASCQKICPANNIIMEAGKPNFQHKCEHCLACLHNCQACAIDWKNQTQGKKRYINSKVSVGDLIAFNSR